MITLNLSGNPTKMLFVSSVTVLFGSVAFGQDLPQKFESNATATWSSHATHTVSLGEGSSSTTWKDTEVITNDAGDPFLNNMVGDCNGIAMEIAGSFKLNNACSFENKDGNQIYTINEADAPVIPQGTSKYRVIGGTGPYSGVDCEGSLEFTGWARDFTGGVLKIQGNCGVK